MEFEIVEHELIFKKPATTSRNVFKTRSIYYVVLRQGNTFGIGEAAPLELLSIDDVENYRDRLDAYCSDFVSGADIEELELDAFPSIKFGLETAYNDFINGGKRQIFECDFYSGTPININGLVWMADLDAMYQEAVSKIKDGYRCIKFKVGAHDFDAECRLLEKIRNEFDSWKLEIRLDANGAFQPDEASKQLKDLARFDIHSIEQPVKPLKWDVMGKLCRERIIDIALDEELIGINVQKESTGNTLLSAIRPQYLILKPNLIGGFSNANQWIDLATKHEVGWWATSALESNIGLNAIAQWVSTHYPSMPQGLGTGSLFTNNISGPLSIKNQQIVYSQNPWDLRVLGLD